MLRCVWMFVMELLIFPAFSLRTKAEVVKKCDAFTRKNLRAMLTIMREKKGIGLAAPQVGLLERMVVMELPDSSYEKSSQTPRKAPLFFVNPKIESLSKETSIEEEGCLSLPDLLVEVERPVSCTVSYQDEKGRKHKSLFHDMEARCIQHEIDHLDGRLLVDYLSPLKKHLTERKFIKQQKLSLLVA